MMLYMYMYCHRSVLKACFNCSTLTKFHNFSCGVGVRCFSSPPRQTDLLVLVDHKGSCNLPLALPPPPPPQSLSSVLMFVPPRVDVDDKFDGSESANHKDYFHFFNPVEQTKIRVKKKLSIAWQKEILTPDDAYCVGSSHGWLAFVHPRSCFPYLFNPLLKSCHLPYVPLPPYESFPHVDILRSQKSDQLSPSSSLIKDFISLKFSDHGEYYTNSFVYNESKDFIQKVAMSSAPSLPRSSSSPQTISEEQHCTVMIINDLQIYFCKLGGDRWHALYEPANPCLYEEGAPYNEIMYFSKDQRFYAMADPIHIEAWDLSDPSSPKREMINPSTSLLETREEEFFESNGCPRSLSYLVESSGDLLLVVNFVSIQSLRFDVYKLNFNQNKWECVECLGDRALFVGRNHSFSLSTRDYPGLRENSIYFTDNYQPFCMSGRIGHDKGIFHLKDNSITPYYPLTLDCSKLPPVAARHPV